MSNLLPSRTKSDEWARTRERILFVVAGAIALAACVVMLALVPAYSVARTAFVANSAQRDATDSTGPQEKALADSQAILSQLQAFAATSSAARITKDVLALRPKGITVDTISYAAGSPSTLILRGEAANRDLVKEYRFVLSADPRFISVAVPISALVGTDDGTFTLTITGRF